MKILKLEDMLAHPAPCIVSKIMAPTLPGEGFWIKFDNCPDERTGPDFGIVRPTHIDSADSEEWADRMEDMWENGASYPMADYGGREGMFDKDARYLVWEKADLMLLREWVDEAISAIEKEQK